ncbi:hypothetical protein OIU76_028565 [Salix suchowensis]|nr:hypothetical protein OIU76_028565 [Salix suchowensis]
MSNYRVVYLRRYDSTIVAMRKTSSVNRFLRSLAKRRSLQLALDAKREALQDNLLEPPRKRLEKPRIYSRRFKYLPDLLGDSVEDFSRRIFIDVGSQGGGQWCNAVV